MTSTRDVHDMLGISPDTGSSAVGLAKAKKKGRISGNKRPDGMAREVFSLLGERAPPIPIAEPTTQFKAKRKTGREDASRWIWQPFRVTSRGDDLVFRHWRKDADVSVTTDVEVITDEAKSGAAMEDGNLKKMDAEAIPAATQNQAGGNEEQATADDEMTDLDHNVVQSRNRAMLKMEKNMKDRLAEKDRRPTEDTYKFEKYNIKVEEPEYDDELYEKHLHDPYWSKEETDYLVNLHRECWGKWHVVADRFSFAKAAESTEPNEMDISVSDSVESARDIDALKTRYYTVCAAVMAAKNPLSNMNDKEFALHEKMTKFSAAQERDRKRKKEALLTRTKGEATEERLLVAELERMYKGQTEQEAELKDLRDRLDFSLSEDLPNANYYTTSAEIGGLLQKLFTKDKQARAQQQRRLQEAGGMAASPQGPNPAGSASNVQAGNKRASVVASTPARLHMSATAEQRFGVKALDKSVSGVTFKSDKLLKTRQLKSAAKTQALANILLELGVPEIVAMPTDEVSKGLETLVGRVNALIDRRNQVAKEENDLKIEREKKAMDAGRTTLPGEGELDRDAGVNETQEVETGQKAQSEGQKENKETGDEENEEEAEEEDDDEKQKSNGEDNEDDGDEDDDGDDDKEEGRDAEGDDDVDMEEAEDSTVLAAADDDEEEEEEGVEEEENEEVEGEVEEDEDGEGEDEDEDEEVEVEVDVEVEDVEDEEGEGVEEDIEEEEEEEEADDDDDDDNEEEEEEKDELEDEDEQEIDAAPSRGSRSQGHKRSASVLSASSNASGASRVMPKRRRG